MQVLDATDRAPNNWVKTADFMSYTSHHNEKKKHARASVVARGSGLGQRGRLGSVFQPIRPAGGVTCLVSPRGPVTDTRPPGDIQGNAAVGRLQA